MVKQTSEKPAERSDPKYKGVRKRKWGKYVSEIRLPNSRERIWLGSYDSAEKAARAFDAALSCLRGRRTTKFNFPDNPPDIAGGSSLTPKEIQRAAIRFAISAEPPKSSRSDPLPTELLHLESPSPSVSEGTVQNLQMETEAALDGSFLELSGTLGSGNYAADFGLFPGYDDFTNEFYSQPLPIFDYGDENPEGTIPQESFLWNF